MNSLEFIDFILSKWQDMPNSELLYRIKRNIIADLEEIKKKLEKEQNANQ